MLLTNYNIVIILAMRYYSPDSQRMKTDKSIKFQTLIEVQPNTLLFQLGHNNLDLNVVLTARFYFHFQQNRLHRQSKGHRQFYWSF